METNTNDVFAVTVTINGRVFFIKTATINSDSDLQRFNEELGRTLNIVTAERISTWQPITDKRNYDGR